MPAGSIPSGQATPRAGLSGRGSPASLAMASLYTRVRLETAKRVNEAARKADQPVSAWLRMAIMEKLERDGG
jgi:hypothetical protein